jgi:hypothetical protein
MKFGSIPDTDVPSNEWSTGRDDVQVFIPSLTVNNTFLSLNCDKERNVNRDLTKNEGMQPDVLTHKEAIHSLDPDREVPFRQDVNQEDINKVAIKDPATMDIPNVTIPVDTDISNREEIPRPQSSNTDRGRVFELKSPSNVFQEWRLTPVLSINPMLGWDSSIDESGNLPYEWKDTRLCCLCMTCGDDDADYVTLNLSNGSALKGAGRLLPFQGSWVHTECALWSSEVWKDNPTGIIYNVHKARSRASKLKCFGCGRPGATVGCNKLHCKSNYHFSCASACGALFTNTCKVYCSKHSDASKDCPYDNFSEIMECLKVDRSEMNTNVEVEGLSCLRVGSLVVHSFGQIHQDTDSFHTRNHIFPDGFTASRIFWSTVLPKKRTLYIMTVSKSQTGTPLFSIRAADCRSVCYRGPNVKKLYEDLIQRVLAVNHDYFSFGESDSIHPILRSSRRKAYGLNGPQVEFMTKFLLFFLVCVLTCFFV